MTRREKILEVFHKHGGMTADALLMNFGMFGYGKEHELMAGLTDLVNYRKLIKIGDVYYAIGQPPTVMDVAPPRYQPPFKPLSKFLPKVSPRGQTIADRQFKTCTSNVKNPFFWNESLP